MAVKLPIDGDAYTLAMNRHLRNNKAAINAELLSTFCGNSLTTVRDWLRGNHVPGGGMISLRLAYFMRESGIKIPELVAIHEDHPFSGFLAELLAFGVIQMPEAREIIGNKGADAVLRAARGGTPVPFKNILREVQEFIAKEPTYAEVLLSNINDLRRGLGKPLLTELYGIKAELNEGDTVLQASDTEDDHPATRTDELLPETDEVPEHAIADADPSYTQHPTDEVPELTERVVKAALDELRQLLQEERTALERVARSVVGQPSQDQISDEDWSAAHIAPDKLRLIKDLVDQVRDASTALQLLLDITDPRERSVIRELLGSELRLLERRTGRLTSERVMFAIDSKGE